MATVGVKGLTLYNHELSLRTSFLVRCRPAAMASDPAIITYRAQQSRPRARYIRLYELHTLKYGNIHCVPPKNRARIFWLTTFTNIDQYQCHLIELFLQH